MARPKKLDDTTKREICALVTAGMRWRQVARYVGCDRATIHRERAADPDFDQRIRRAQMASNLSPLEAMRRASATHWRAAAWMLDRQDRREQAPSTHPPAVTARELDLLGEKVADVLKREIGNPLTTRRIAEQIEGLFFVARTAASGDKRPPATRRKEARAVRQAMEVLDKRFAQRRNQARDNPAGIDPGSSAEIEHVMAQVLEASRARQGA